jgi:hypothetical protein
MDKSNVSTFIKNVRATTQKHQPEILTGIGIAGFITTTIMAVKATPKALDRMAEVKEAHASDSDKKAFCKDVLLKVAPVYIPAAIIGGLSISCVIGASSVNHKRTAALATAYTISESALKEYRGKVVETIGEKKEEAVRAAIAKDRIDSHPVVDREVIITGNGTTRCFDPLSSRYFDSDIESIRKAVNELNRRLLLEDYISLNDFYYELGLDSTEIGDTVGWRSDRGLIELNFHAIMDKKENPCLAFEYSIAPYHDYDK